MNITRVAFLEAKVSYWAFLFFFLGQKRSLLKPTTWGAPILGNFFEGPWPRPLEPLAWAGLRNVASGLAY